MGEINAVAFDLDHTLYDRNATWDNLGKTFTQVFSDALPSEITIEQITQELKRSDYKGTYEETSWRGMHEDLVSKGVLSGQVPFARFEAFIRLFFPNAIKPYEDTYEVLCWCRAMNYHPSVITNGHVELQKRKLKAMDLMKYLDECIICDIDSGAMRKPKPYAFLELSRRLKIPVDQILYVGDNPINDIAGARNAGMHTAWLSVMDNWRDDVCRAEYEISSLRDLMSLDI